MSETPGWWANSAAVMEDFKCCKLWPSGDQDNATELIICFCKERDGKFLFCCCLGASRTCDPQSFYFICRGREMTLFTTILCLPGGLNPCQAANVFAGLISGKNLSIKRNPWAALSLQEETSALLWFFFFFFHRGFQSCVSAWLQGSQVQILWTPPGW